MCGPKRYGRDDRREKEACDLKGSEDDGGASGPPSSVSKDIVEAVRRADLFVCRIEVSSVGLSTRLNEVGLVTIDMVVNGGFCVRKAITGPHCLVGTEMLVGKDRSTRVLVRHSAVLNHSTAFMQHSAVDVAIVTRACARRQRNAGQGHKLMPFPCPQSGWRSR